MHVIVNGFVGILCLLIIGATWQLCQKVAAVLTGQRRIQEEFLGIGICLGVVAALVGIAFAIAWVAGI